MKMKTKNPVLTKLSLQPIVKCQTLSKKINKTNKIFFNLSTSSSTNYLTAYAAVIIPEFSAYWHSLTSDDRDGIITILFNFNNNYLKITLPEEETDRSLSGLIPNNWWAYPPVQHLSETILDLIYYVPSLPVWPKEVTQINDYDLEHLTKVIPFRSKNFKKSLLIKILNFKKLIDTHLTETNKIWQYGKLLPASSRVFYLST